MTFMLVSYRLVSYADADGSLTDAAIQQVPDAARVDFENDACQTTLVPLFDRGVDFRRALSRDDGLAILFVIAKRIRATSDYARKYCKRLIGLKTSQLTHQDIGQMDMRVRMCDELKRGARRSRPGNHGPYRDRQGRGALLGAQLPGAALCRKVPGLPALFDIRERQTGASADGDAVD